MASIWLRDQPGGGINEHQSDGLRGLGADRSCPRFCSRLLYHFLGQCQILAGTLHAIRMKEMFISF